MSQILSRLAPAPGTKSTHKRKGRGPGSGLGKTAGRGQKGQKARHPGGFSKVHFQGGQTPMQRRLPKIGFNVPFPIETIGINVESLERFDAGTNVDEAALRKARLVQGREVRIKILGEGELTKKLTVTAHGFSKTAAAKIEKAGGKCVVVPEPRAPKAEAAAS